MSRPGSDGLPVTRFTAADSILAPSATCPLVPDVGDRRQPVGAGAVSLRARASLWKAGNVIRAGGLDCTATSAGTLCQIAGLTGCADSRTKTVVGAQHRLGRPLCNGAR